ncbi:Uma2 family endonuclease [Sorangium sp. So ce260]|uniref:Uma2 family endonuclease n=1 Tax=Sorangium sp. So ce260 TaxID=3133291 RepID=UPI003F5D5B0B
MRRHEHVLLAPGAGASGRTLQAPPAGRARPRVDDRLAPPETRVEYLDGAELFAAPADAPHATQHFDLTYVLGAHVAAGYRGAVDMLTRADYGSDYAPDASVFAQKPDRGGHRRLEELAFEVSDKQALAVPTSKARRLIDRGVRRVFCILVKQRRVLEWSRETDGWQPLPKDAVIEDRCLVRPLPIQALLDATSSDDAVARALLQKGVPALEAALAEGEARGEARGAALGAALGEARGAALGEARGEARGAALGEARGARIGEIRMAQEAITTVLRARGVVVPARVARTIAGCDDPTKLRRWLKRAATAATAAEVVAGPRRKR